MRSLLVRLGVLMIGLGALAAGEAFGDEPTVHVLVPGFEVKPLPLRLTNINYLAFAPDGTLFGAAYNGKIYRISDADGDGLPDRADLFWDKDTIATPLGLLWAPEGLYVTSHRKVSLLRDDDKDGRADREEIVATGWTPIENTGGNVDALGLARDKQGNLYFGLGCANYANAYLLNPGGGGARYSRQSERGAILKLSPDRKTREIVATGIRFPYAIRFNRQGDLFATDQEGETWLPGGNPLDELNHILPGRHYGFPPRHEKYLPDVADEPPVIGFGPQHQSACGMVFNEASNGWKSFGPKAWEGDAMVAGFSRGKVWRVALVKTPAGYVGKETLLARSNMLIADVAVSPSGALFLTCHSGSPDWGTGPQGEGRLFRITYTEPSAPQPVAAWPSGPLEARVAFDRPVDPAAARSLVGQAMTFGDFVRAADRFEVHKPPYKAVQQQEATARGKLRIAAAKLADDGRTLVLTTDPHPFPATYALTIPTVKTQGGAGQGTTVDLAYDLSGVEAAWSEGEGQGDDAKPAWSGWWPHLDPDVVRALMKGSAEHERALATLAKPGKLTLRTLVELPKGEATLTILASGPVEVSNSTGESAESAPDARQEGRHRAELSAESTGEAIELELKATTGQGGKPLALHASYRSKGDPTERPLPINRQLVPWAPAKPASTPTPVTTPPSLAGGDPVRGEAVFSSEQARCASCHKVRGKGGEIGPDLSNLVHRDAASVYRDISEPSATINPDFVSYTVALKDGRVATGIVRAEGSDAIRVLDTNAKETIIPRSEVEELRPSSTSIMPTGLVATVGESRLRDLVAFLTTEPPAPKAETPPIRTKTEVEAVLGPDRRDRSSRPKPLQIVLVSTKQDHGPGEHDYPAWRAKWQALLSGAPGVTVTTADGWPAREQWEKADAMVFYFWNHDWSAERYRDLDRFLGRGGGLVLLHAAVIADKDGEALAGRIGLAAQPPGTKYRHGALDLSCADDDPITKGLGTVHFVDETYWPPIGDPARVKVLGTAVEEGKAWPMLWTFEPGGGGGGGQGKGRVFASILGHYAWTFDDPLFRAVVLRGLAWSAGQPTDRFRDLVTSGVTLREAP